MAVNVSAFWEEIETVTDPAAYKPKRNTAVSVTRLAYRKEPYYVLKEPTRKTYIRLSEEDYAFWWQMNGYNSTKDLLFYCLKRYQRLPVGHLNNIINELRQGGFLQDQPTNIYDQITAQLEVRGQENRGRRLLHGILHTEIPKNGLDPFFTSLYKWTRPLLSRIGQWLMVLLVISGSVLFALLYSQQFYSFTSNGILGLFTPVAANLFVIVIHEVAHGLATKHVGRELDRGGFLIYWGLPALFVDTRDTWMSSKRERILVSWAGPYSGLLLGGIMGWILTAVLITNTGAVITLWATFFYQIAFLAYLSVIINLNPLLELDGYFILMDWLEIPGLRSRTFLFWREEIGGKIRASVSTHHFWQDLSNTERILTFFGAIIFTYAIFALWLAFHFWQSRLFPLIQNLWGYGLWGKIVLLLVTAVLLVPIGYYIALFAWSRLKSALNWLAHRNLLAHPSVLALLTGIPILVGIPLIWSWLAQLPSGDIWQSLFITLLYFMVTIELIGVARQLTGSRFQWAIWALAVTPLFISITSLTDKNSVWYGLSLMVASGAILICGLFSWFTINRKWVGWQDQMTRIGVIFIGLLMLAAQRQVASTMLIEDTRLLVSAFITFCTYSGLALLSPMLLNFLRSRFMLPWILLALAIALTPWLLLYPQLQIPLLILWLLAVTLYLLIGALAQFSRYDSDIKQVAAFSERERLISSFNHFMEAFYTNYEFVFGGRQLATIRAEISALDTTPDLSILEIASQARHAILVAIARLDELAGTNFTHKAGQAAYDSLPWLEEETLARYVLASTQWGVQLAEGFIHEHDHRVELIRYADIFAGLDMDGVEKVTAVIQTVTARKGTHLTEAGHDATHFYLIDTGEVGVFHNGEQVATLLGGGYFGTNAIAGQGNYNFSYYALTPVTLLTIFRDDFDPLLRDDTTLSQQVSSGVEERRLLRKMPLFKSLSPQELAAVDARMQKFQIEADLVIVRQGERRSHLYIIAQGVVEFFVQEGSHKKVIGQLGSGEHFGEYDVTATNHTRLLPGSSE